MSILNYKGFIGSIDADVKEKLLYGKLLYVNDLVTYEATTVSLLEKEFKKAVDDYIKTCSSLNREPLKPLKGSLNVRIGHDLHKKVALHAAAQNLSINEFIKTAVLHEISRE